MRIVVLNTEYFGWEQGVDLSNRTHAAAADAHLHWLDTVVAGAQGKVMILGHIPPASGELLLPSVPQCHPPAAALEGVFVGGCASTRV